MRVPTKCAMMPAYFGLFHLIEVLHLFSLIHVTFVLSGNQQHNQSPWVIYSKGYSKAFLAKKK